MELTGSLIVALGQMSLLQNTLWVGAGEESIGQAEVRSTRGSHTQVPPAERLTLSHPGQLRLSPADKEAINGRAGKAQSTQQPTTATARGGWLRDQI